jgi:hypothetical protein
LGDGEGNFFDGRGGGVAFGQGLDGDGVHLGGIGVCSEAAKVGLVTVFGLCVLIHT